MKCKEDIDFDNYILSGQSTSSNLLYLGSSNHIGCIHIETINNCVDIDYIDNSVRTSISNVSNTYTYNLTGIEHSIDIPLLPIVNGTVYRSINNDGNTSDPIADNDVIWTSDYLFEDIDIGTLKPDAPLILPLNDEIGTDIVNADGSTELDITGTGFVFRFTNDVMLGSFEMLKEVFIYPSVFYIYGKKGNRWIEIFNIDSDLQNEIFTHAKTYNIKAGFSTSEYAFVVKAIRKNPTVTMDTIANNSLELLKENIQGETAEYNRYKVQISSLRFYPATNSFNDYNINMLGNSITNIDTLSFNRLILNDNIYTELITKDDLNKIDFKLEDYTTPTVFRSLIDPRVDATIGNTNKLIPYYLSNIHVFDYDSTITTKYLEQLQDLSTTSQSGILFQNNDGDLYKSYILGDYISVSNISVLSNITIHNDITLDGTLKINHEIIQWLPEYNIFTHGTSNVTFQNEILYKQIIQPIYHSYPNNYTEIRRDLTSELKNPNGEDMNDILEYEYMIDGITYTLRQPHGYDQIISIQDTEIYDNVISNIVGDGYWSSMNIKWRGDEVMTSQGYTKLSSYHVYNFIDSSGFIINYMDFYEYESSTEGVLKGISFSITNKNPEIRSPDHFYILGYSTTNNRWEELLYVNEYDKKYHTDLYFKVDHVMKYKKYRIAITKLNVSSGLYQYCGIRRLRFYTVEENNIGYHISNDNIDIHKVHHLNIDNNTDVTSNTKLVLNGDLDYGMHTHSVLHLNSRKDETSNLLRMMIIDDHDTTGIHLLNSVVHSIDIFELSTYYKIGITNIQEENIHNILTITRDGIKTKEGCLGVNVENNEMVDDGIAVKSSIMIYNTENTGYVAIKTDVNSSDTYNIILPTKQGNTKQFLQIESIDRNVLQTKWTNVAQEVFKDEYMYFGGSDVTNMFDIEPYCNMTFTNSNVDNDEYMTHMRKAMIGPIEQGDSNVLLEQINKHSLTVVGSIYTTLDVTTDSDIRYKTNIEKLEDVRSKIEKLSGYTYNHSSGEPDRRYAGLIAQEVNEVMPECVMLKHDEHMRVMYSSLSSLFVECIKDIYKEIDNIKK